MTGLAIGYCILACAAAVVLLVGAGLLHMGERSACRCEGRYGRLYMQMVAAGMLGRNAASMSPFPRCESRGARNVLARLLALASSSIRTDEPWVVRRMVVANGIEGWLLRRIGRSRGYVRARYMAMLSALPVSTAAAEWVASHAAADARTRFGALMVAIAADPASMVRRIGSYPLPLTRLELAQLTSMLRRGVLPIACTPLLESPNRNLRMLGLCIVRIFGITEAEELLLRIVAEGEGELAEEALHTLAALHLPVTRRCTASRIRTMHRCRRHSLLRRLAAEGYSAAALTRVAPVAEADYAESLAASYKRMLACGWSI